MHAPCSRSARTVEAKFTGVDRKIARSCCRSKPRRCTRRRRRCRATKAESTAGTRLGDLLKEHMPGQDDSVAHATHREGAKARFGVESALAVTDRSRQVTRSMAAGIEGSLTHDQIRADRDHREKAEASAGERRGARRQASARDHERRAGERRAHRDPWLRELPLHFRPPRLGRNPKTGEPVALAGSTCRTSSRARICASASTRAATTPRKRRASHAKAAPSAASRTVDQRLNLGPPCAG